MVDMLRIGADERLAASGPDALGSYGAAQGTAEMIIPTLFADQIHADVTEQYDTVDAIDSRLGEAGVNLSQLDLMVVQSVVEDFKDRVSLLHSKDEDHELGRLVDSGKGEEIDESDYECYRTGATLAALAEEQNRTADEIREEYRDD